MGLSKELLDALNFAQAECITAARQRDPDMADELICNVFAALTKVIEAEPQRKYLTYWREAVAKGETQAGYEEWRKEQVAARNGASQ